jgi:hypothetical protein
MNKLQVYLVMGGYDYEGADVIYAGSTKEKAEIYLATWEKYKPWPEDRVLKNRWKWRRADHTGAYDYMEIQEVTLDEEIPNL